MKNNKYSKLNQTNISKKSHKYHWIEFSLVVAVISILAVIVIPTITTIAKSADYAKAYDRSTTIIKIFEVANADAAFQSIAIPNTTIEFTSHSLSDDINNIDNTIDSHYRSFIANQLYTYLLDMSHQNFTFKLVKTSTMVILYYWDTANESTSSSDSEYRNPNYVCFVQNKTTEFFTYDDFLHRNLEESVIT